jgi:YihY family inner membrane protein
MFLGLVFLYKLAPNRLMKYSEIWLAAICATILLLLAKIVFIYFTVNITNYSVLYGTLGSIMAVLIWVYLTGVIIIYGGCISASQFEVSGTIE